jgi:hypothetical protein
MKTTKLIVLVLSALALAALSAWFFTSRYGGRPDAAPAVVVTAPTQPAIAALKPKKLSGRLVKRVELLKRRVSRLQEPGEALGGGKAARLEADAKEVSHQ